MINNLTINGYVSKFSDIKTNEKTGRSYITFTVIVQRDFLQNGKREADFINCVAWAHNADYIKRNFRDGDIIAVTGKLRTVMTDNVRTFFVDVSDAGFCGLSPRRVKAVSAKKSPETDGDFGVPF